MLSQEDRPLQPKIIDVNNTIANLYEMIKKINRVKI
ncbi:sensor histidine kinase/response regulator [Wolbachia endosymbiont of Drosophila ananassae]|nr:sensor histidine kinase/response regulator [Wolbachia endosymbiont of Drosophila ananassae]